MIQDEQQRPVLDGAGRFAFRVLIIRSHARFRDFFALFFLAASASASFSTSTASKNFSTAATSAGALKSISPTSSDHASEPPSNRAALPPYLPFSGGRCVMM